MKQGLQDNGFQVDAYASPQQALQAFKPNVYDLAILDIRMPGMSGFMLYRKLKEQDLPLRACFVSAFEMHEDELKKAFPSMPDCIKTIIKKPVTIDSLIKEIAPVLKLSAAARAGPGEHILVVYETPAGLVEHALEFLWVGLEKDENVMFVTDAMPIDSIRSKIAHDWKSSDLKALEESGRLALYYFREWYMPDGKFDLDRAVAKFTDKVSQSTAGKRKGFRFVGDMDPFFAAGMIQQVINYESALAEKFGLHVTGLCACTKDRIQQLDGGASRILRMFHSPVIREGEGEERERGASYE